MPSAVRLSEAIDEFLASRKTHDVSPNTIRSEKSMLLGFLAEVGNLYTKSIGPQHVDAWLSKNHHWEPSTRAQQIARLSGFQKWLTVRKYVGRGDDFLEGVRKAKIPRKRRPRIALEQFSETLDRATVPRDRVIVATGLFLLVRASELTPIRWRDDHDDHVSVYRTKTGDWDDLPVGPDYREELDRWKRHVCREMSVTVPDPSWYVHCAMMRPEVRNTRGAFLLGNGEYPLLPDRPLMTPRVRVQEVLRQLGIEEKGSGMHTLRRSGARAYFESLLADEKGKDEALAVVQSMLGHASPTQTLTYIGWETNRAMRDKVILGRRMITPTAGGKVIEMRPRG